MYEENIMNAFKLSKQSRTFIENFAKINPAMIFRPGNVIRSVSPDEDVIAIATIAENIPDRFAIKDLSKFLSVLSLYDNDAEMSVDDGKTLTIKGQNNRTFVYTLSSENKIVTLTKDTVGMPKPVTEFALSASDLN